MRKSVLSALARNEATVRDPGSLSVKQLVEEFAHKRSMLKNADNDYVQLGGAPEQAPNGDGRAERADQAERTDVPPVQDG